MELFIPSEYLQYAFKDELPRPTCVPVDGLSLQTYSSTDHRSWSLDRETQAQFLLDLVSCRKDKPGSCPVFPCEVGDGASPLVGQDSLLNAATDQMTSLQNLLLEKNDLKSQLSTSQEKLRILNEEHQAVNAILTDELHAEVTGMLEGKIKHLRSANKIDKNDENEFTKILDTLIKREKSAKILEAQNCYLRRLIAKLSTRCRLESMRIDPERSVDVEYLQSKVNSLGKEVCLLRELEDKQLKTETASRGIQGSCEDNDAENVNTILAERDALREKCKNFAAMKDKIYQWKHEAEQFQIFRTEACNALRKKDEDIMLYREDIDVLQCQIKKMERCCRIKEQEEDSLCSSVECLKDENRKLREEICRYNAELKKLSTLQSQVKCLSAELCEKNCVIEQYDVQFQNILGVVENLQNKGTVDIVGLQDVHSQTHNEIEELAATTRITLDHIHKELENRNIVECNMARSHEELLEAKESLAKSEENLMKAEVSLAKTEEDLDLANCEMKLMRREKELEEALLRANNADCQKTIQELKTTMDQMEQQNKTKLHEMEEENKQKIEQMKAELEKARGDFEKAKQDFEQQKLSWAEERKTLVEESGEGDRLREEFEKEKQAWLKERNDFFTEKQNWAKERQACDKLNADLKKEREEMERVKQDFDKARQSFDKERQEMRRDREGFANERKQFEQKSAQFEKLKQEMETERQACEAKAKNLAETLNKNEQRRLDTDTEMSNLRNKNDELNKALKAAQTTNDELNKALKDAQNKKDELSKQLKDCQNEAQAQKEKISKLTAEVDKLNKELSSSQGQLKEVGGLVKDISNVKDRNEQLSTIVQAADLDCQKQLVEERRKIAELKKQLAAASEGKPSNKQMEGPTSASDCQKLLSEERRKNAELKKQLATANTAAAERKHLEKEIEGHRSSNNALRNSISKLTSKINTRSAADFERELRVLLDNFTDEICKWRCEKHCRRLTRIQEIAKKICEHGLECLTLKELVYLHQQMCEAARRLTPGERKKEKRCCKCSGEICPAPTIPNESDVGLLQKLAKLESDIQSARENLRRLQKQQEPIELDEYQELETMRASTYRLNRGTKNIVFTRSRMKLHSTIKEEYDEAPTKDRY